MTKTGRSAPRAATEPGSRGGEGGSTDRSWLPEGWDPWNIAVEHFDRCFSILS